MRISLHLCAFGGVQDRSRSAPTLSPYRCSSQIPPLKSSNNSKHRPRGPMMAVASVSRPEDGIARTPHSPFHFDSHTQKRAFEGWYLRLTLPDNRSLAFIHCIEDPAGDSDLSKITSQVMWGGAAWAHGGHLMEHTRNVRSFWASNESLELGAVYSRPSDHSHQDSPRELISHADTFFQAVKTGFQVSETLHYGALVSTSPDGDMLENVLPEAHRPQNGASRVEWAYSMAPLYGWGGPLVVNPKKAAAGSTSAQNDRRPPERNGGRSTTGWLAACPAFDPQWQICIAHARAGGWVSIDGQRFEFNDATAYVEKNWGAGFPSKWFWVQCNQFIERPDVTVTAVAARRRLVQPVGSFADIGILGIHFNDEFIECVPWNGSVNWEVRPWGSWKMSASNLQYVVELEASTAGEATWLFGPHATAGFVPFCRDSFEGKVQLRVWKRQDNTILTALKNIITSSDTEDHSEKGELVLDVHSAAAAVECGGAPWDSVWHNESRPSKLVKEKSMHPLDGDKVADMFQEWLSGASDIG